MTENLKPCPFCGGDVFLSHEIDGSPSGIMCKNCRAMVRWNKIQCKKNESFGKAMNKYAEAWNRRVDNAGQNDT